MTIIEVQKYVTIQVYSFKVYFRNHGICARLRMMNGILVLCDLMPDVASEYA